VVQKNAQTSVYHIDANVQNATASRATDDIFTITVLGDF